MNKRALALWLGLFFYILLPLAAQSDLRSDDLQSDDLNRSDYISLEFSGGIGTLWVEDDGAAVFSQYGFDITLMRIFNFGLDITEIKSTLPWADISVFGFLWQCGLDTPDGGFNLAIGNFNHSFAEFIVDDTPYSNDEGQIHFINITTFFHSEYFSITPYMLFGEASWSDGDMYNFFGKPKIPSFIIYGMNLCLDLKDWFKHSLSYYSLAAKINIFSNNDLPLFNIDLDAGLFMYQFIFDKININFNGTLGWFFTGLSLEGALTSSNQSYFLFPYLFYNVDVSFNAQAGFAAFGLQHSIGFFKYNIDLGVFNIFNGDGRTDLNYRRKRLFGGGDFIEESSSDLKGLGAAFLILDAGLHALPIIKNIKFSMGVQKIFLIPWGYEKLFGDESEPYVLPDMSSILRTALFSGLSIRGSIRW